MTVEAPAIRLGLLVDGETCAAWELAALRALLALDRVELAAVLQTRPFRRDPAAPDRPLPANPLRIVSAAAELGAAPRLDLASTPPAELDRYALDVIFSTSRSAIAHDLADRTRGGVWALVVDGGDADCTQALLRALAAIPAQLVRLARAPGRAHVLDEGHFRNEPFSPRLTRARVLYGCAGWPARRVTAWRLQGDRALQGPETLLAGRSRRRALGRALLPLRQLSSLAARVRASCYDEKWAVAISARPIESFLEEPDPAPTWLASAPDGAFHADPFGVDTADGPVLLAEAYDFRRRIGRIDALRPTPTGAVEITRDVIPRRCHLSYPYLVADRGNTYCVPETHQERRIDLYRAAPFPEQWRLDATLVDDFAGIDATLFRHGGRWWLLCGNQDDEPYAKLYGFFADTLAGPWQAHPLNPLKCDPRSSRPGGTPFEHAGKLYRPAQDCSRTYGGAVTINEVLELSPIAFSEAPAAIVAPEPEGPYPDGLHTLSAVGRTTVLDGKRLIFDPTQLIRAGRHFFARQRAHAAAGAPEPRDYEHGPGS